MYIFTKLIRQQTRFMNIDGFEEKNKKSLSFIFKGINLSTVDFLYFAIRVILVHGGQVLKGLKMNESDFFLSSKPSMFMTLCYTLVCYLINFVYA